MRRATFTFIILLGACSSNDFSEKRSNPPEPTNELDSVPNIKEIPGDPESIVEVAIEEVEEVPLENVVGGLVGGHFDLDTSSELYAFDDGETDGHVHEYDDKYNLNGVNFLDLKDDKLNNLNDFVAPGQQFRIVVNNAALSPLGYLKVNDKQYNVLQFQAELNAKEAYSLDTLKLLSLSFPKDVLQKQGIIPTATGCVRDNTPGKLGEYRNGALLVQVVDANNYTIDPVTKLVQTGLIWEASLFWHRDNNCYIN